MNSNKQCVLPEVIPENFVACRTCLQSTMTPIGGVVRTLAISNKPNGSSTWRVTLSRSTETNNTFPDPDVGNFVAIRALLSQHVPAKGVLKTTERVMNYSTTTEWLWEITYGIKTKPSRVRKVLQTMAATIKNVTPCLAAAPKIRSLKKKAAKLSDKEKEASKRRYFFNLRQKRVKKEEKPILKGFVQGETLEPDYAPKPRYNAVPHVYEDYSYNTVAASFGQLTIADAVALRHITLCGTNFCPQKYASALVHLKMRAPAIKAKHVPKLLEDALETLGLNVHVIDTISATNSLYVKTPQVRTSAYTDVLYHVLCEHEHRVNT